MKNKKQDEPRPKQIENISKAKNTVKFEGKFGSVASSPKPKPISSNLSKK